jgi:hypothetical protein
MVDTWKMAETAFYHAETLLKIYEIPDEGKLQHRFYTAEYLTVGAVNMNACNSDVVLFHDLVKDGLFKLIPHLDCPTQRSGLWLPVANIREIYFNTPTAISQQDMEIARALARNICQSLSLAFLVNLLALQKRQKRDELFSTVIRAGYIGK